MIRFIVKDTRIAFEAVEWCIERFSNEDWDIRPSNQGWRIYNFEFKKPQDATLFGLTWSEHV
jgi:hypothetical protein